MAKEITLHFLWVLLFFSIREIEEVLCASFDGSVVGAVFLFISAHRISSNLIFHDSYNFIRKQSYLFVGIRVAVISFPHLVPQKKYRQKIRGTREQPQVCHVKCTFCSPFSFSFVALLLNFPYESLCAWSDFNRMLGKWALY